MTKLTQTERQALSLILEFVEKWNKKDEDIVVAESQGILQELLDNNY